MSFKAKMLPIRFRLRFPQTSLSELSARQALQLHGFNGVYTSKERERKGQEKREKKGKRRKKKKKKG